LTYAEADIKLFANKQRRGQVLYKEIEEFKEKFNIKKICGLMMLHYFKWPWCLENLVEYVDEIYLLLHFSNEFSADWHKAIPKVKGVTEVTLEKELNRVEFRNQGNRERFREQAVRMLDDVKPDLVFFPDEDESFPEPEYLVKDLRRFYKSRINQLAFRRINFWDSMDTVRKDIWNGHHGPHVRLFKWRPGLTYQPYLGFNRVSSFGKKRTFARTGMKHYAFMRKEDREWRYHVLFKGQEKIFRNLLMVPKLVKYTNARWAPRT
jgi:hypothetical protein